MSNTPSQRELFTLFLPLALSGLFYPLASPIVNAALARTSTPELALAAFAVARSLSNPLISPLHGMRQVVTALVRYGTTNCQSTHQSSRYTSLICPASCDVTCPSCGPIRSTRI